MIELNAAGRAPQPNTVAAAAALCQEVDVAGLHAPGVGSHSATARAADNVPVVDGAIAELDDDFEAMDPASLLDGDVPDGQPSEDLYAEMEGLLAMEKVDELLHELAAPSSVDTGDTAQRVVRVAGLISSSKERESRRQRVAESCAAAQIGLAAMCALRHPTSASTPGSGAPSQV